MSNPLNKHLQNAFQDFEGLHIAGTIPLREELLNEIIAHVLQEGVPASAPASQTPSAAPQTPTEPRAKVDVNALLQRVKKAQVRFEEGRAVIDFEVGV
jgi:hypothetical protein